MTAAFLQGLALLLALCAVHFILMRSCGIRYSRTLCLFWSGWILSGAALRIPLEHFIAVTITFLLLWSMHMAVLLHLLNSVSLAMIRLLDASSSGELSREEFLRHFSADNTLALRIRIMKQGNLISEEPDGSVSITPRGRFLGALFGSFQRLFRITYTG